MQILCDHIVTFFCHHLEQQLSSQLEKSLSSSFFLSCYLSRKPIGAKLFSNLQAQILNQKLLQEILLILSYTRLSLSSRSSFRNYPWKILYSFPTIMYPTPKSWDEQPSGALVTTLHHVFSIPSGLSPQINTTFHFLYIHHAYPHVQSSVFSVFREFRAAAAASVRAGLAEGILLPSASQNKGCFSQKPSSSCKLNMPEQSQTEQGILEAFLLFAFEPLTFY